MKRVRIAPVECPLVPKWRAIRKHPGGGDEQPCGSFSDLQQTGIVTDDIDRLDRRRVRQQAVRRFGWQRMVDEHIAYYQNILEQGDTHGIQPIFSKYH